MNSDLYMIRVDHLVLHCLLLALMKRAHNCAFFRRFLLTFLLTRCPRFHTDPSGTFMRYDAKAIGSGSEAAQSELQDKWHKV